ncbi:MAG: 5-formyltetrahydrofolate cyclo-ligase [Gammaproteobacteria bacterium]|nr:5-formyltetrahydrofolate cyclo-ligase [Gammaproteobacteria bacterium]
MTNRIFPLVVLDMPPSKSAPTETQAQLRAGARAARVALGERQRCIASERIESAVAHSNVFARTSLIGCYLSCNSEVDTWGIIARAWRMNKRIFAPVTGKSGSMQFQEITPDSVLRRSHFGILEPVGGEILSPRKLQIVLTPLVAFDAANNRIGMGGGFYDRTFAFLKHRKALLQPKLVGLAFACQQVEHIPANPWDIRLYSIITEIT